jgi:hypothetical protein
MLACPFSFKVIKAPYNLEVEKGDLRWKKVTSSHRRLIHKFNSVACPFGGGGI